MVLGDLNDRWHSEGRQLVGAEKGFLGSVLEDKEKFRDGQNQSYLRHV